jgi:predicted enzyme related to lactoylglutathione lyase
MGFRRRENADVVGADGHFAWYELITTDVKAAKTFYTGVIGLGAQDVSLPDRTYILLTAGQVLVSGLLDLPESARAAGGKPHWVGYVRVKNVDATADRITRLGGTVQIPPTDIPDISRFSVFTDAQAATLAILKSLNPDHDQPANMGALGRVGWHELFAADSETALAFYCDLFGWKHADTHVSQTGPYQLFSAGGQTIGGMLTKPAELPASFWLYYFNIDSIDAAVQRVRLGGGQILDGPLELPGGSWIAQCSDPQGALFGLRGRRGQGAVGYFERAGSRNPSDAGTRR